MLAEVVNDDGTMARLPQLEAFAAEHGLRLISIADLIRYRRHREKLVRRVSEARIPTQHGDFTAYVFESLLDGAEHMAFVRGEVAGKEDVLVRVHSECLTGDVFGSLRCDCGLQLDRAHGDHRRRRARASSCTCAATKAAASASATRCARTRCRTRAATPSRRTWSSASRPTRASTASASQILVDLGVTTMRLMTNNPAKYGGLEGYGLEIVERVPLHDRCPNDENIRYLRTKQEKMGHLLEIEDEGLGTS